MLLTLPYPICELASGKLAVRHGPVTDSAIAVAGVGGERWPASALPFGARLNGGWKHKLPILTTNDYCARLPRGSSGFWRRRIVSAATHFSPAAARRRIPSAIEIFGS